MENKEILTTALYKPTVYDRILMLPVSKYDIAMMFKTDETISSAVMFIVQTVVKAIGNYANQNENYKQFINQSLQNVENFNEKLAKFIEDYIVFGLGIMEKVYEIKDNKVVLKDLVNINPLAVTFSETTQEYEVMTIGAFADEKIIVMYNGNNPLGESNLAKLFPIWQSKRMLMGLWINAMERFAMPIIKVRTTIPEKAVEQLRNLWSEGIVAVDSTGDVDAIKIGNIADDFRKTIEYLNVQIYRSMLLPQLLLTTEFSGTYNLGRVHLELFKNTIVTLAKKVIEALNNQLIKQMLELNFINIEDYGSFEIFDEVDVDVKKTYAEIFERLANAGFLDTMEDNNYVRSILGLPIKEG